MRNSLEQSALCQFNRSSIDHVVLPPFVLSDYLKIWISPIFSPSIFSITHISLVYTFHKIQSAPVYPSLALWGVEIPPIIHSSALFFETREIDGPARQKKEKQTFFPLLFLALFPLPIVSPFPFSPFSSRIAAFRQTAKAKRPFTMLSPNVADHTLFISHAIASVRATRGHSNREEHRYPLLSMLSLLACSIE